MSQHSAEHLDPGCLALKYVLSSLSEALSGEVGVGTLSPK